MTLSIKATRWAYSLFEVLDVPPVERSVLLALCYDHTDASGCFPSQERIALLSGYRRRRVNDALSALEKMGLIRRKTSRKGGKFQQTSYTLFGAGKPAPCADGGTRHRVHKKAHGHRVQTGAQYRGIYNTTAEADENLIEFPSKSGGVS